MSEFLFLDVETRSETDLKAKGAFQYFADPTTDVLIARYAFDDGAVGTWLRGDPCPRQVTEHVEQGRKVSGWNVFGFEKLALENVLGPRYGWPIPKPEQYDDTAQTAAASALPRSLGDAAAALNTDIQKDKEGYRLIRKFSIPRKPKKDEPPGLYWNEPEDHPEDFTKFVVYCGDDVGAERGIKQRIVPLSERDRYLAILDNRINSRGIRIDVKSARAALRLAERAKVLLDRQMADVTGKAVTACSQVAKLVEWINAQGVPIPSAAKAEIEELLETDDLPAHVRRALELRQEAAKTSVSKLTAFLARAGADERLRGAFLFRAAGTGRYSSVGAQVHNLPRPRKVYGDAHPDLKTLFENIRHGDPEWLKFSYGADLGKPLHLVSDALRSFIWAAPGHELCVADYSGIEGAVAAWFADEAWKVEAMFELIRDPDLPDLYRRAAAGIFNTTPDQLGKKDPRRQVGKVSELSLQYQGGVGAFRSMARNYSLKIEPVYEPVWAVAPEARREAAEKRYEGCVKRGDPTTKVLSRKAWLAAELVKVGWRVTHPAIGGTWKLLEDGIRQAIESQGSVVTVKKVQYLVKMGFLWCRLPSGRCLAYGSPRLSQQVWAKKREADNCWSEESEIMPREQAERLASKGLVKIEGGAKPAATALGVDSVSKRWVRFALYGGLAFENIVQAIALDLLENGIVLAEENGYPVIGHVHDEIITEKIRGSSDVRFFEELICRLPAWAKGLPLTASGFVGKRYRKD